MSKRHKKKKLPIITTQPRRPHWNYTYQDLGDYALISTRDAKPPYRTTRRTILKQNVPKWMQQAIDVIDVAYDPRKGYCDISGFGKRYGVHDVPSYTFYAQAENT